MSEATPQTRNSPGGAKKFFLRGLAIVLPTVLTIWLGVVVYQFVQDRIAQPINSGIRELVIRFTDYPSVDDFDMAREEVFFATERELTSQLDRAGRDYYRQLQTREQKEAFLREWVRRARLEREWNQFHWLFDLAGLVVAIIGIYIIGVVVGSWIGRRLYNRGEALISRIPLIRKVYPSVKQVTDFFVGENAATQATFSRVVAVQYPRKGIWSVGLVTGGTMDRIQKAMEVPCLTVFIPSSPTPFTGYVITVRKDEVVDLPISLEEALKFAVSLGVLVPPQQQSPDDDETAKLGLPMDKM
ncbi:MAG: DUF502 domain-containing protein [Phycisphaeraceae bacterium]|nr:DUF502 domain-containing protein [Phycisphaeraceae bacterium]